MPLHGTFETCRPVERMSVSRGKAASMGRSQIRYGADHPKDESRRASRLHVSKAGTIKFVGGGTIDCMVLNLSSTGASLKVSNPGGIPERFILVVPGDGLHRSCSIVWRKEHRIGVTFG
jgi:PilZ domain